MATMRERQRQVQLYRGQIPSPGAPTVAWREDRVKFWTAIARGEKTDEASVLAGVSSPVGYRWFRHAGGVTPFLPPIVSGRYLSFHEREDIAIWRAEKLGVREIARRLGRDPSTISRELRRNASTRTWGLEYKASTAQWHAERRARRPKAAKLSGNDKLREYVQERPSGEVRKPDGRAVGPLVRRGAAGTSPTGPTDAGSRRGAPSRSRSGSRSTSPMMGPCGSATRRSTRPATSKGAAPSSANSWPACGPEGRCGSHEREHGRSPGHT